MYDSRDRTHALELVARGATLSEVSRATGIARSTIRSWAKQSIRMPMECWRCNGASPSNGAAYAALLGYYLGDGCIAIRRTHSTLRVSCDATLPGIVSDVSRLLERVHPSRGVFHVRAPGVIVIQGNWKHWPCLFPQHGPGRKHERPIVLADWQREVVVAHPGAFLRGLFHSDGCRVNNWTTRMVEGTSKRYDYPRWQFSNRSEDIHRLCQWALDLADVPWRRSGRWTTSVSRREGVSLLDQLIGPKT